MNTTSGTREAVEALKQCLLLVPSLRIKRLRSKQPSLRGIDYEPDVLLDVRRGRSRMVLVGEYKNVGQPRIAREVANQLLRAVAAMRNAYGVFMAPYISPSAASICTQEGIGYLDLAGNCRLAFGEVFILQEGRPNPLPERRDLRSLYSPKAERVLRVLLDDPRRQWRTRPLAREADVSIGQVSKVRRLLMDREWLTGEAVGISLAEPEKLLTQWSESYDPRRNEETGCYGLGKLAEIESKFVAVCRGQGRPYALAQFSASARIAPSVRYLRSAVYYSGPPKELAHEAGLKPVAGGANVTILTPYDEGVYYGARTIGRALVVSPVQAYLDLKRIKGRGDEAAEFLLETEIRPRWQAAATTRKKR